MFGTFREGKILKLKYHMSATSCSLKMKWAVIIILGCSVAETTLGWTYHHSLNTLNWKQAREWCQTNFTDMVVIRNQSENDYLVSWLPNRTGTPYYWIGITKEHPNDSWTWIGNNSTWIGNRSWAPNEPNNNHSTEFCVEIYVNTNSNRGQWNDEKCSNEKYAVCYEAQCNATSCERGRCQEVINSTTCLCEPGFEGDRCQTPVKCPRSYQPDDGYLICSKGNGTFNTTCQFKCHGFLVIGLSEVTCEATGEWKGPRPVCSSYKQALLAVAGCGALSSFFCICFCCIKHRKRKKITQERQPEDATSPPSDVNG